MKVWFSVFSGFGGFLSSKNWEFQFWKVLKSLGSTSAPIRKKRKHVYRDLKIMIIKTSYVRLTRFLWNSFLSLLKYRVSRLGLWLYKNSHLSVKLIRLPYNWSGITPLLCFSFTFSCSPWQRLSQLYLEHSSTKLNVTTNALPLVQITAVTKTFFGKYTL